MTEGNFYQQCADHLRPTSNYLPRDSQKELLRMVGVLRDVLMEIKGMNGGVYHQIDDIIDAALAYNGERAIPKPLRGESYHYTKARPEIQQERIPSWGRRWARKDSSSAYEDSNRGQSKIQADRESTGLPQKP